MKSRLYGDLERYCSFGPYPFHMPGHKRLLMPVEGLPYGWDLTEVPGTDDLHEAEGILRDAMERTAEVFGAERTWYLVGGSTCGLLSGIRALAPAGKKVIAARNCHKSVYHALELGDLQPVWLMPPMLPEGVCGSMDPQAVAAAVEENPDAACVILTSPTYEGVISDIAEIARICHSRHIPLLVDEAHGAHLGFGQGWPDSALHLGADVVVQSVHKTLPSLTQTALLHLGKGSLAEPQEIERQLDVFETSSPSYPLLTSIDGCSELLAQQGESLFAQWKNRLDAFDRQAEKLSHLHILGHGGRSRENIFAFDPGKIPICTGGTDLTGRALAQCLRSQYGIETEMSQGEICLAMTGMGDSDRAMQHLAEALAEIDAARTSGSGSTTVTVPQPGRQALSIARAVTQERETVLCNQALSRISGEYVWAYPPGIPLLIPGEEITGEFLQVAEALEKSGTPLHHSHCLEKDCLCLLKQN